MYHFQSAGCAQHPVVRPTEEARRLDQQKRPKPLAAAKASVAHGFEEVARAGDLACEKLRREKFVEACLDSRGYGGQVLVEGARS
jgi:hypothetical protein